MLKRVWVIIAVGGVLAAALLPQMQNRSQPLVPSIRGRLPLFLHRNVYGWQDREVSLGSTEAVSGLIINILACDDYVYREYRRGDVAFSVYIAYWGEGRAPIRNVASHAPDHCWILAGWRCEDWRQRSLDGLGAEPSVVVQWRLFSSPSDERFYVQFWHLAGGFMCNYGYRYDYFSVVYGWKWLMDVVSGVFTVPPEQYFVRITSNRNFETLERDAGYRAVMSQLMGIAKKQDGSSAPRRE